MVVSVASCRQPVPCCRIILIQKPTSQLKSGGEMLPVVGPASLLWPASRRERRKQKEKRKISTIVVNFLIDGSNQIDWSETHRL